MHRTFTRSLAGLAAGLVLVASAGVRAEEVVGTAATEDAAAVPVADGETLFMTKTCFTCHGKDAKTPILPMYPKIAGQNAEYALQQMLDIKSGVRSNGMTLAMKGIMHLVTEEEIHVLAEYVSTLEP